MTANKAIGIGSMAISTGAQSESAILLKIQEMSKQISSGLVTFNNYKTVMFAFISNQLNLLEAAEIAELDKALIQTYNVSLNLTIEAEASQNIIIPERQHGYTSNWLEDGKNYSSRIKTNILNTRTAISGLLLGWRGKDPIILMGLIQDELDRAAMEWQRLIRTELEAAYSQGARDGYLMRGALYGVIENDSPCPICMDYVGDFKVNLDGALGRDLPPYHPNCKCIFLGVFAK